MGAVEYFANKPQQIHYWEPVSSPQSKLWLNTPVLFSGEEKSPPVCIFSPTNSAELAQEAAVKSLLNVNIAYDSGLLQLQPYLSFSDGGKVVG